MKNRNRQLMILNAEEKKSIVSFWPEMYDIEVTSYCNFKCRMCPHALLGNRIAKHLNPEVIERMKKYLKYAKKVALQGDGEPFLNPDIKEIICVLHESGVRLNTTTNLSVMDRELAELINKAFDVVTVSCDACEKELYEERIRLITLTWNYDNCLGSPNSRDPEVMSRGLKPFGKEVVERMNDLGMLIDVSHLSDGGFWDCIKVSRFPIVASHSNARALCPHPRNLTDEMLHALGNKGGVAGMNFYSAFLRKMDRNRPMSDGNDRASLMDIALHGARILDQAGEDALALGTDLDGFDRDSLPYGIRDVLDMEKIWEELKRAGLTERQIEKAAHENVRRVIHEVWKG